MSYSQKTIQNLKPEWYLILSKNEKLKIQETMKQAHNKAWSDKPVLLKRGTILFANQTTETLTKGRKYAMLGHFCTLITTIYGSEWNQFVTLKNNNGYSVKMNLRKFDLTDTEKKIKSAKPVCGLCLKYLADCEC